MNDIVSKEIRSRMMSGIRGKNTAPEMFVRKMLHSLGFRFRLHRKDLPGKPDIVLPRFKAVIFVNGCFWHAHSCSLFKWPTTNTEFWREKIARNRQRDATALAALEGLGWRCLTVWECETRSLSREVIEKKIFEWIMNENLSSSCKATHDESKLGRYSSNL